MSGDDTVEVVELAGRQVVFLARRSLPLGKTCWVRMAVRDPEGWLHIQSVPVVLEQGRSLQAGQTAYIGCLPQDETVQPLLSSANAPGRTRRDPRHPCHLRVLAPELGAEEAWAVDFSLSGLQIQTPRRLQPGAILHLHLYTPGSTLLPINARVAWCRSHPEEGCRAGLEFRDPPPYLQKELRHLHDLLTRGS
ncbi:MAG: PilZ domain-containing protein [Candidatus Eremiobacteraeota bacterium]|nr:PilZ domain-containing protein [Candidatus Eremiobacteraeota bacterium]MCW5865985.1 PilZ domain-containing protein [Candidatus Eremiobacteraeota bacterium]